MKYHKKKVCVTGWSNYDVLKNRNLNNFSATSWKRVQKVSATLLIWPDLVFGQFRDKRAPENNIKMEKKSSARWRSSVFVITRE